MSNQARILLEMGPEFLSTRRTTPCTYTPYTVGYFHVTNLASTVCSCSRPRKLSWNAEPGGSLQLGSRIDTSHTLAQVPGYQRAIHVAIYEGIRESITEK